MCRSLAIQSCSMTRLSGLWVKRRVRKVALAAVFTYLLFLCLSLGDWRRLAPDPAAPLQHFGRSALSDRHQPEGEEAGLDREEEPGSESHVILPEMLDLVLQQQPGAAPARKRLSRPAPHSLNVIVEEALPGTFNKNVKLRKHLASDPEYRLSSPGPSDGLNASRALQADLQLGLAQSVAQPLEVKDEGRRKDSPHQEGADYVFKDLDKKQPNNSKKKSSSRLVADAEDPPDDYDDDDQEEKPEKPEKSRVSVPVVDFAQIATQFNLTVSKDTSNFREVGEMTLYSAFYDDRLEVPVVRLVAIGPLTRKSGADPLWCVFPSPMAEPAIVVSRQTADCKHMKRYCYYMLHCQVPEEARHAPVQWVSVLQARRQLAFLNQTGQRVRMPVSFNARPSPRRLLAAPSLFAVCVPPLSGKLSVVQMTEFLELNRLLGAVHFLVYRRRVSSDLARLLALYEAEGVVTVLPWSLPAPNQVWQWGQGAALGDCLMRAARLFDFVLVPGGLNEFLIPARAASLADLMRGVHAQSENVASIAAVYSAPSAVFYSQPGAPSSDADKMVTLRATLRARGGGGNASLAVARPERVLEVDGQRLVSGVSELYVSCTIDAMSATLHRYAPTPCTDQSLPQTHAPRCDTLRQDRTVWRYQPLLTHRTKAVLRRLNNVEPVYT